MSGERDEITSLRAVVRARRMHYRLISDFGWVNGVRAQVGLRCQLLSTQMGGRRPVSGSVECDALLNDLHQVARAFLPPDDGPLAGAIEPFNRALYDDPALAMDDVALSVQLRPRSSLEDPAVVRALALLRQRLHELGVYEVTWQATAS